MKNRNKVKSLLAGLLAVLTVLTMLGGTTPTAQAKSSSELKKQLEQLKEEKKEQDAALKELKGQLKDNVNEMEDVVSQKDIIDQEIFYINEQISNRQLCDCCKKKCPFHRKRWKMASCMW